MPLFFIFDSCDHFLLKAFFFFLLFCPFLAYRRLRKNIVVASPLLLDFIRYTSYAMDHVGFTYLLFRIIFFGDWVEVEP